jgi:predicted DCC family thiol-disulfide oxidoreductase YuxK
MAREVTNFHNIIADLKNNNWHRAPQGIVLYDQQCALCEQSANRLYRFWERYGLLAVPLYTDGVTQLLGRTTEELTRELHVYTPHGKTLAGLEAILYVLEKAWWLRPLVWLLRLKGFYGVSQKLYRLLARNRQRVSAVFFGRNTT